MLYAAPDRLTLLPFPQSWDGAGKIALRAIALPRGTPRASLMTGVAGLEDAPAFEDGKLALSVSIIPSLDKLPDPADVTDVADVKMMSPEERGPLFEAVEAQFDIDPAIEATTRNPRRSGRAIKKLLTPSYQSAFAFPGPRTEFAVLGDEYACAMRRGCQLDKPKPTKPPNTRSWGQVLSQCLRQPLLAERLGLLFVADLPLPDPRLLEHGGWLFLGLQDGSDYVDHVAAQPQLLARYAARIPALTDARSLFAPVLFPLNGGIAGSVYDEIFAESAGYDDGFAKIVHCAQQTSGLPIGLETVEDRYHGPVAPVRDTGIQLGWDDEQLLIWTNRQIADPTAETRGSPWAIRGYRIDVREAGQSEWHSMMQVEADLSVGPADLGEFNGELNVEVGPVQLENLEDGDFWMPAYFTQWQGRSLVTDDVVGQRLSGATTTGGRYTPVGGDAVPLRYGRNYEFRVRLSDLSSGSPAPSAEPINAAPAPTATCAFRRHVPPGPALIEGLPDLPDTSNPPTQLKLHRPDIAYPAAVFTDAPGAEAALLARAQAIQESGEKDAPGIPDPDTTHAEIVVYVENLSFDTINEPDEELALRRLYSRIEAFPTDPSAPLLVDLDWNDVPDVATLGAGTGPLKLPRARNVRIAVRAIGRDDPALDYWGSDAARFGPVGSVQIRADGLDELGFFQPDVEENRLRAVILRPQDKETEPLLARLKSAGRGVESENSPLHLLAEELDLEVSGHTLWAEPGRRVIFGCSRALAHTISPDGSALTFSSDADFAERWLAIVTVAIDRDWSWFGDGRTAINIKRDGADIGVIRLPRAVNPEVMQNPDRAGSPVDRSATYIVFFDAIDPKPTPPAHPEEMTLSYELEPVFAVQPEQADAALALSIDVPIAAPPAQTPKLLSAGLASSPYVRTEDYATTAPRDRMLWLEFDAPPANPNDIYFARVLSVAPDPMLSRDAQVSVPPEPPLPIDPELIRVIRPGQSDDEAGLNAMQRMIPTDSERHFLLPLPPGMTRDSLELLGFFTYEVRLGHAVGWSTARARFGPPLRVTGVQHASPTLTCQAFRTPAGILVTAPFATPVHRGRTLMPSNPASAIWIVLYAQVVQADAADRRNILLARKEARYRRKSEVHTAVTHAGDVRWSQDEIEAALTAMGLPKDSPLSVLAVEMLPERNRTGDPLGSDLGSTRVLRTSPLVRVPPVCIQPPCPV
jgi:hypothetical protein